MNSELETLSFGDLLHVQKSVGKKAFNAIYRKKVITEEVLNSDEEPKIKTAPVADERKRRKVVEKRSDKNAPQEITSKKPVTRKRNVTDQSLAPVIKYLTTEIQRPTF